MVQVRVSPRNIAPQATAKPGIRKVTVIALAGPTCAIRRKYRMYAKPVHSTASRATWVQAATPGICAGQNAMVGTTSARAAPSWLPAATASGGTPVRQRLVKLAEYPYETDAVRHAMTASVAP